MRGPARLVCGWIAALVATVLAAGSHTLAGLVDSSSMPGAEGRSVILHAAPSIPVVVLTLALSGLVCTGLAGRVLSWWRLLGAVGFSQLLFHAAYSLSPGHAGTNPGTVGGPTVIDPHAHHQVGGTALADPGLTATSGSASGTDAAGAALNGFSGLVPAAADHSFGLAMLVAHLLAAVLTVVVLRGGEQTVLAVFKWLALRSPAGRLVRWRPPVPFPVTLVAPSVGMRWQPTPVLKCLWLRGPPVTAASC